MGEYRRVRSLGSNLNRRAKNAFFRERCTHYRREPRQLWSMINAFTGRTPQRHPPVISVSAMSASFSAIVSARKEHSASFSPPPGPAGENDLYDFREVAEEQVLSLLKAINPHKASGPDHIPGCLLLNCAKVLAPSVTSLFNKSLSTSTLPEAFRCAVVCPVYKSGNLDPNAPGSYRPISLLPILSKLLEKIVHAQLMDFIEDRHLLPDEQFAFRKHHSTEDALTLAINRWTSVQDRRHRTGVVFLDMSKAFDSVLHHQLLKDLFAMGISHAALPGWIANYLSCCRQQVRIAGSLSEWYDCTRGVPQGSVLGPLLFSLYIRDAPNVLRPFVDCTILFVDDISFDYSSDQITKIGQSLSL